MPNITSGWKLWILDSGQWGYHTYATLEEALTAACPYVQPLGGFPRPVRIEGPSGEKISQEQIEDHCRRPRP